MAQIPCAIPANTTTYVYDSLDQLTRENNQAAGKTWVYTYDDGGNIFRHDALISPTTLRIDSKRRRRLQEKRMAMGHKRDDHEEAQRENQLPSW